MLASADYLKRRLFDGIELENPKPGIYVCEIAQIEELPSGEFQAIIYAKG
jgi:hypothetical protein